MPELKHTRPGIRKNYYASIPVKPQWMSTCPDECAVGETDSWWEAEYSPGCRKGPCIGSCRGLATQVL